jgi:hypothetical protein
MLCGVKSNCPFVLFVGTKELVKRKAFEEYIRRQLAISVNFAIEKYASMCYNQGCCIGLFSQDVRKEPTIVKWE